VQVRGSVGRVAVDTKMARLPTFDGTLSKISRFVTACKLYIKIKIRDVMSLNP